MASAVPLAMHVTCNIHKLSLVRKPLVLSVPHYWSSLVRLAHLFEARSFKQRFREALASTIIESFRRVEVQQLPPQVMQWRATADAIFSRCEPSRRKYIQEAEALYCKVVNSDPTKDEIIHWCLVQGCSCECSSEDECLVEVLRAFLGLLGRGFPVPLLQRWKHYGPANAFMARGRLLHNVLPRVLRSMMRNRPASKTREAEALLERAQNAHEHQPHEREMIEEHTNHEAFEAPPLPIEIEESFAEMNGRRLRQVCAAMRQDSFLDDASMVNLLCAPIDIGINKLMKRTRILHQLRNELVAGAWEGFPTVLTVGVVVAAVCRLWLGCFIYLLFPVALSCSGTNNQKSLPEEMRP